MNPKVGTMFQDMKMPLRTQFYGILLSSNCLAVPATATLSRHLGIGQTAAFQFARKLRKHLTMLESGHALGGANRLVHVDVQKFDRLSGGRTRGKHSAKVLVLADTKRCAFSVLPDRRATSLAQTIAQRIEKGAAVFASEESVLRTLLLGMCGEFAICEDSSANLTEKAAAQDISFSASMRARMLIKQNYKHVSKKFLEYYLGEQAFRFNYRRQSLFWQMIDRFDVSRVGTYPQMIAT